MTPGTASPGIHPTCPAGLPQGLHTESGGRMLVMADCPSRMISNKNVDLKGLENLLQYQK